MKKMFFLILLLSTIMFACEKDDDLFLGDIFEVKKGQTLSVSNIQIRLDSVRDSRCPDGAACIQAGEAVAYLTFIKGNEQVAKSLKVMGLVRIPKPDTAVIFDKKAILLNVSPYPSVSSPIPQSDYKALMKLE